MELKGRDVAEHSVQLLLLSEIDKVVIRFIMRGKVRYEKFHDL